MKHILAAMITVAILPSAMAMTPAKDIAATINLNGYACGNSASDIKEKSDAKGNKTITAKCQDGKRYKINISNKGRVKVSPQ